MADIKFDEAEGNINLAKEYLKNNKIFKSYGFNDSKFTADNDYNNTIHFSNFETRQRLRFLVKSADVPEKLYKLAKKIEENADLFCQLELLIRKIPLEDTKNIDLKLIIQNCIHYSYTQSPFYRISHCEIVLYEDSPLLALGYVAQLLVAGMVDIIIQCTKETAPVCSLFLDLCHGVGLKGKVLLAILPRISKSRNSLTLDFRHITDFPNGGVGIVSGNSDVDSAVDTFLASPCRYPWRVSKIFVQECAFERFKKALAWKTQRRGPGSGDGDVEVACAWSYRCGNKVFLQEAAGSCGARVVALEAYRTVRELLAVLAALRPLAASLWSADVESLEIAHGLSAPLVWINEFADFRGPPRVSQAFYSVIDSYCSMEMKSIKPVFDGITNPREASWLRLNVDERKYIVLNVLSKIDDKEAKPIIEAMKTLTFEMDSFVYVTENMVSTGMELRPEMLLSVDMYPSLELPIINFIIKGGAILMHLQHSSKSVSYMFYENLRDLGVPVLIVDKDNKDDRILINPIIRYKVFWTSYGTKFAK